MYTYVPDTFRRLQKKPAAVLCCTHFEILTGMSLFEDNPRDILFVQTISEGVRLQGCYSRTNWI